VQNLAKSLCDRCRREWSYYTLAKCRVALGLWVSVVTISPEVLDGKFAANRVYSLSEGQRWYAVHTLPFAEARAEAQLENQNFHTFLPKRLKTIRHARKLSTAIAPFFPRYLFVALNLHRDRWRSVNGTFGVSSLIMAGDLPCPAPHGIVESMLAVADAEGALQLHSNLKVGAPVRLAAGPFAEQLGILDRLDDSGRIRVLLNIFGRQVAVCLNRTHVLPAA
jgi:transcription antitermination factor NusG